MAFNRGGFNRRGEHGFSGRRDFDRPQMYPAVCSNCGKSCEVPFKPTGEKPVYCSDCFEKKGMGERDSRGSKSFRRPDFHERDRGDREQPRIDEQLKSLNAKLDKIIDLLSPKE